MAAVLAEPWAAASHRSAAVLHKLPGFRPGRPEITVRPGANARGRLAIIHRGVDVRTTTVRGIPTVTVEQTFVDLAQIVERASAADCTRRCERTGDLASSMQCETGTARWLLEVVATCDLCGPCCSRFGAGDATDRTALEAELAALLQALAGPGRRLGGAVPWPSSGYGNASTRSSAPGASSSRPTGGPGTPASRTSSATGDAMPRRPLRASSPCGSPGTSSPRTSDGSAASCWRPGARRPGRG